MPNTVKPRIRNKMSLQLRDIKKHQNSLRRVLVFIIYGIISVMSKIISGLFIIGIMLFPVTRVYAQSNSANYSVEESSFSSGSGSGASASYSSQVSAGDLGVGSAYSTNYGAYAGPISPNEEYLEMVVTPASINFGTLSDSSTATGTAQFYVRAYLNSSYTVMTVSAPPTNESGDTLDPMTATALPTIATEQFGINLVDNVSPNIGTNPALQPNGSFANGQAATGYGTVDQFRYNQGEIIAEDNSDPAWGQTNYTISYIANISGITEAGVYEMTHILVAVTTF